MLAEELARKTGIWRRIYIAWNASVFPIFVRCIDEVISFRAKQGEYRLKSAIRKYYSDSSISGSVLFMVTEMESWGERVSETHRNCRTKTSPSTLERETTDQLLQGIPDEVTLDQICTRLPWKAFHILSSVSHAWRQAIRSRQVYDARVRSHSTETLVVLNHNHDEDCDGISLYSMREKTCYQLPPIPHVPNRIPLSCQCVSLDGKIYLLGGIHEPPHRTSNEVFVLDLAAGQRGWKQCASMHKPRMNFGCGAIDGKIYVFGGLSFEKHPVCESEVYDPNNNSWSSIKPMTCWRFGHRVAILGEELVVYGGSSYDPEVFNWVGRYASGRLPDLFEVAAFLEFYHPGKDEWRRVKPFAEQEGVFIAQGKLHVMTCRRIFVLNNVDAENSLWIELHSSSFPSLGPNASIGSDRPVPVHIAPITAEAVNGDMLALVTTWTMESKTNYTHVIDYGPCLLQTTGFGSKNRELVWERANCFFYGFQDLDSPFLCPIHL